MSGEEYYKVDSTTKYSAKLNGINSLIITGSDLAAGEFQKSAESKRKK